MTTPQPRRPEILAPAGTLESFTAALASGADAVYLGVSEGFNARARATAFTLRDLPELVRRAHDAHAKLYLTLNTLVFENELPTLLGMLREVIAAGVDALIVQDPATALLARRLCPEMRLHASTQMTISSAEGARFAATLGIERVVLPRELSVQEIAQFTRESTLEAEVFVHGALCMAWSGQCLTSEAFSERSANRGQCSQACRMPYDAIVDGERRDFGDLRYLLSPGDLAAHDALPDLVAAGVHSLKIEGRYKGPSYVLTAVDSWRNWRRAVLRGVTDSDRDHLKHDIERTRLTFSRGGSVGFLRGDDHQSLVGGTTPKHRGLDAGVVRDVRARSVLVALPAGVEDHDWLRPGVGVKFELVGRSPKEHDPEHAPGGPLFGVRTSGPGLAELRFGDPGPELTRVRAGDLVRLTGDPELNRETERRLAAPIAGRIAIDIVAQGAPGSRLRLTATGQGPSRTLAATTLSSSNLQRANAGPGLNRALLEEKLGALGGTPFRVNAWDTTQLQEGLHLPVSELKHLRRELVAALEFELHRVPWVVDETFSIDDALSVEPVGATDVARAGCPEVGDVDSTNASPARLIPLCRTEEQLEAVIASGLGAGDEVELDWMDMVGLGRAVARAREAGLKVTLATVRVQKPGEEAFDRRIARLEPDAVLVRHWGALMHFAGERQSRFSQGDLDASHHDHSRGLQIHGDFSLNVTNSVTARHLLGLGVDTLTASHDLNAAQLTDLLQRVPRGRMAVTLHHHVSTFHNSHCVYAHLLSKGADYRTCGRPCEKHRLALRDYAGHDHPVVVDVSCRNTVFNAFAQSAAPLVPRLLELGVSRFRVEFVWEGETQVKQTLAAYQKLLRGQLTAAAALDAAAVHERYGVTTPLRLKRR